VRRSSRTPEQLTLHRRVATTSMAIASHSLIEIVALRYKV
jgi:hypothetical protein